MREWVSVRKCIMGWKNPATSPDNRFNSRDYCQNRPYATRERYRWMNKPTYRVFVSGVLKPPATNRGVGQWTTMYFRCHSCDSACARPIRVGDRPTGRHYCYDCEDDAAPL